MDTPSIIKYLHENCKLILAGYGGSHAYGTNIPTSDIDIRGIFINPENEIFGIHPDTEQITVPNEDVVVYSIKRIFQLLMKCNPNVIEILGLRPQEYLYLDEAGQLLIDNRHVFLSKQATYTFGNYAKSQLNRLINRSGRAKDELPNNEIRSLTKVITHLENTDLLKPKQVSVYAHSQTGEPWITLNTSIPFADFVHLSQDMLNVHSDYSHSVRNDKAVEHGKLKKHMMHLLRLYMMGIDILEKHEIITYRAEEHDLLMDIRNGKYTMPDDITPTPAFEQLMADYVARFEKAAAETTLPDRPDMNQVNDLLMHILRMYY